MKSKKIGNILGRDIYVEDRQTELGVIINAVENQIKSEQVVVGQTFVIPIMIDGNLRNITIEIKETR